MSEPYANLYQLLACYFNQDWRIEADTVEDVCEAFRHDSSLEELAGVADELDRLIAAGQAGTIDLDQLIARLGNEYHYEGQGFTAVQWLIRLRTLLGEPYENLFQVMASYFGQDFDLWGDSDDALVRVLLREESDKRVEAVRNELDHLIAAGQDGRVDVDRAIRRLGGAYYYQGAGLSGIEWLKRLRRLLDEPYPDLRYLFGAYFHQDWDVEADTDEAVLRLFAAENSAPRRDGVRRELDDLIAAGQTGKIDDTISGFGNAYRYQADGLTGLEWLARLRALLGEGLSQSDNPNVG